jgi:hypothetical protein
VLGLVAQVAGDSVGAGALGLAGGGVSVVLLAVVQGYFQSVAAARSHELERLKLERSMDDSAAIAEVARAVEGLTQWARSCPGMPAPPVLERRPGGPFGPKRES